MKKYLALLLIVLPLFLLPKMVGANVIKTLTLDGVSPNIICNQSWSEDGVNLSFVPTTPEDCCQGGNCSFWSGTGWRRALSKPVGSIPKSRQFHSI